MHKALNSIPNIGKKIIPLCQVWHKPNILACKRQRQEDPKFQASLGCSNNNNNNMLSYDKSFLGDKNYSKKAGRASYFYFHGSH
jgi:hypothetical protein